MGIWGDAYGPEGGRQLAQGSTLTPLAVSENQFVFDGSVMPYHPPLHGQFVHPSSDITVTSLPRAQDHPLFYVGIYTLIGMANAVVNLVSIIAMFLGALRASRLLFKRLLVGVVHATMHWHVSPFVLAQFLWF
jgi:hypothetical protein